MGRVAALLAAFAVLAARAGQWMQVSCVNPDGSAAPSDGWSGYSNGPQPVGSGTKAVCSPGSPMFAFLSNTGPADP